MFQLASDVWESFWDVVPISDTTINFIAPPLIGKTSFLIPLYLLLVFIVVVTFIIMKNLRYRDLQQERTSRTNTHPRQGMKQSVIRTFMLTCVAGGLLFALRMDYGWYKLWRFDQEVLSPMSIDERIAFLEKAPINYFAQKLKTLVPQDEKVRIITSNSYFFFVLRYYLLPVKISENGNYMVVDKDNYSVDPTNHILLKDGTVVEKNDVLFSLDRQLIVCRKANTN